MLRQPTEEELGREIVGMLEVNCYFVPVAASGTLYIIDPGSEADRIIKRASEYKYEKVVILLTHAHVDHIGAAGEVKKGLNAETVYLHRDDLKLYQSPDNHLMPFVPAAKNLPAVTDEYESADFSVIFTPGHSRGCVCYYFKHLPALFSGDTIFCDSIGRTDLPGGSYPALINSIKEGIFTLPDDLNIYPGHGPYTRVGDEKKCNQHVPRN